MQHLAEITVLHQELGRNHCGSRRHQTTLAHRLCPDSTQATLSNWRRLSGDTLKRSMNQRSPRQRG